VAGATAEVLAAGSRVASIPLSLELGAQANIDGTAYTAMGALKRSASDGGWTEYLLYAPRKGFLWLVETSEGWQRASVEDIWPMAEGPHSVVLDGRRFQQTEDYGARVDAAIGAFNWQVKVGDTVRILEYKSGAEGLAAEISDTEMTFSRSKPVPLDQVRAWFGQHVHAEEKPHPSYVSTAKMFLWAFLALNFIPAMVGGFGSFTIALLFAAFIYVPAWVMDRFDQGNK
jgi:hypothetical protein